jgi:replicative DNA helicase
VTTSQLTLPPQNIEAEQSVLGGLMLDNNSWDLVADRVVEEDFYRGDHRLIFRSIASLAEDNKPFDVITLSEWLESNNEIENVGGLAYLGTLAKNTPTAANIAHYADIVRERSVLRSLISASNNIAGSAFNTEGRKVAEILDSAEQEIFKIAEQGSRNQKGFEDMKTLLARAVDKIDMLFNSEAGAVTGIATGFTEFDKITTGLQNSDLIIIAGRPAMGKTSFAMNIAEHAATKEKKSVAVFSMEMSGEQLATRLISSLGRINANKVRTGQLDDDDWQYLTKAVSQLQESKIFIDDTGALTPTELRSRVRRIARANSGLDLVVIDYLQLMTGSGKAASENRATEISEISRSLKAMAKEMNIPVIALSQLNRSLESRPNKRPIMSDLRESGAIEQDADIIVFIYRDEIYNEESPDRGVAEIILGKQRHGSIGTVKIAFQGEYTRFENLAPTYMTPPNSSYSNEP